MPLKISSVILSILVWTTLPDNTSPFILDTQKCIALPPCYCNGNYVYCQSKSLTTMPKFEISNITGGTISMFLNSNRLVTIPSNAFRNLTVSNDTNFILRLDDNQINNIETNAFAGIRDADISLDLSNNNFSMVPFELQSLSKLQTLNLQANPISSLDPSTMRALGGHLKSLDIDLSRFNSFPTEMSSLTSLIALYIMNLNVTHLADDDFDGFANTLHILNIQNSQFEKVPVAVCHLHNLQLLIFTNNNNIQTNGTLLDQCASGLTSVDTVSLRENKLRYMPNVFESFPSMTVLNLNSNQLSFVHTDTIPNGHPLTSLNVNNNDFTRIPYAINKLPALEDLYMQGNKITSIEDLDLASLSRLQYLELDNNPIEYISPVAFKNNLDLYKIGLEFTKLRQLPNFLAGLHDLRYIYLYGSPIECKCDHSFSKSVNLTAVYMNGYCDARTIEIKTYIRDDLPNCP